MSTIARGSSEGREGRRVHFDRSVVAIALLTLVCTSCAPSSDPQAPGAAGSTSATGGAAGLGGMGAGTSGSSGVGGAGGKGGAGGVSGAGATGIGGTAGAVGGAGGAGAGGTGAGGRAGAGMGGADAGVGAAGGAAGTAGAGAGGAAGTAGQGGSTTDGGPGTDCPPGVATSVTAIMKGTVPLGTQVALSGVVATSPKFNASKGATGECLWGVFVSDPVTQAVEYSAGLVLTMGAPAPLMGTTYGACPSGTDLIPSDTIPGDALSVTSSLTTYVRASCATSTTPVPAPEVRIANACAVRRESRGKPVPLPATPANVAELTNSVDEATHRKWTGVLIRLPNVQAVNTSTGGPVGSTGSIQLTNGVRVRDRIYQGTTTASFAPSQMWSWIVGISHLDVCTWSIEPRDPCTDFNPKSLNCP